MAARLPPWRAPVPERSSHRHRRSSASRGGGLGGGLGLALLALLLLGGGGGEGVGGGLGGGGRLLRLGGAGAGGGGRGGLARLRLLEVLHAPVVALADDGGGARLEALLGGEVELVVQVVVAELRDGLVEVLLSHALADGGRRGLLQQLLVSPLLLAVLILVVLRVLEDHGGELRLHPLALRLLLGGLGLLLRLALLQVLHLRGERGVLGHSGVVHTGGGVLALGPIALSSQNLHHGIHGVIAAGNNGRGAGEERTSAEEEHQPRDALDCAEEGTREARTGDRLHQQGQSDHRHGDRGNHGRDLVRDALVGLQGLLDGDLLGTHHHHAAGAHRHTGLTGLEGGGCSRAANADTGDAASGSRGSDPHVQGGGTDGSHLAV
mmetsp:Transcript_26481/g.57552  ORF Transcript_26481/g.57552 Transcript_26481/m.57552 type:complete len:379 (+) Transcript_26481:338-1474(+)